MPLVLTSLVVTAGAVVAAAAGGAIPYRVTPAVPAGSLVTAILATLVLLLALVVGLLLARRFGWLQTWVGGAAAVKPADPRFRVTAKLRVSAATFAYIVECGGGRYLVVESSRQVAVQPQVAPRGGEHANEA